MISSLQKVEGYDSHNSKLDDNNGFYKIVRNVGSGTNATTETSYLRQTHGGLWIICDKIPGIYWNVLKITYYYFKPFHNEQTTISKGILVAQDPTGLWQSVYTYCRTGNILSGKFSRFWRTENLCIGNLHEFLKSEGPSITRIVLLGVLFRYPFFLSEEIFVNLCENFLHMKISCYTVFRYTYDYELNFLWVDVDITKESQTYDVKVHLLIHILRASSLSHLYMLNTSQKLFEFECLWCHNQLQARLYLT